MLSDASLVELARKKPSRRRDLDEGESLPPRTRRKHGDRLLDLVRDARGVKVDGEPSSPRRRPLSRDERALVDVLTVLVRLRAEELEVAPPVLAPRAEIEAVAVNGAEASAAVLSASPSSATTSTRHRCPLLVAAAGTLPEIETFSSSRNQRCT